MDIYRENALRIIEADLLLLVEDGHLPGMAAVEAYSEYKGMSAPEVECEANHILRRLEWRLGRQARLRAMIASDATVWDKRFINNHPVTA